MKILILIMASTICCYSSIVFADGWNEKSGFEEANNTQWKFYQSNVGGGGFDKNKGTAHSGNNNAWLSVNSGWSSVGKTVVFSPYRLGRTLNCAAKTYIRPFGKASVNFEVIDPSNWEYVTLKTVKLSGSAYQSVLTDSFIPKRKDLFVRVSVLEDGGFSAIHVDDLTVSCQYY